MFTKGQSGELAWVTSSNIPSPLKWFLGPFSDFASSLPRPQADEAAVSCYEFDIFPKINRYNAFHVACDYSLKYLIKK